MPNAAVPIPSNFEIGRSAVLDAINDSVREEEEEKGAPTS